MSMPDIIELANGQKLKERSVPMRCSADCRDYGPPWKQTALMQLF